MEMKKLMDNQVKKQCLPMIKNKMKKMKIKMMKANLFKVRTQFNSMEMTNKIKIVFGTLLLEETQQASMT
jgi:hypothetical protein